MPRYLPLIATTLALAFAPAPVYRPKQAEDPAAKIARAMEGFRTRIPPAQGMGEQNGKTVKELEPYLMSHLSGVARRMKVTTRAECIALMPYIRDRDCKLRFIAVHAISEATKAYPSGMSVGWFLDLGSDGHREMAARFAGLVDRMDQ